VNYHFNLYQKLFNQRSKAPAGMVFMRAITFFIIAICATGVFGGETNLLQNGDFSAGLQGWEIKVGSGFVSNGLWKSESNDACYNLGQQNLPTPHFQSTIGQSILVQTGEYYLISFAYADGYTDNTHSGYQALYLTLNDELVWFQDLAGPNGWQNVKLLYRAGTGQMALRFWKSGLQVQGGEWNFDSLIRNIVVTSVPSDQIANLGVKETVPGKTIIWPKSLERSVAWKLRGDAGDRAKMSFDSGFPVIAGGGREIAYDAELSGGIDSGLIGDAAGYGLGTSPTNNNLQWSFQIPSASNLTIRLGYKIHTNGTPCMRVLFNDQQVGEISALATNTALSEWTIKINKDLVKSGRGINTLQLVNAATGGEALIDGLRIEDETAMLLPDWSRDPKYEVNVSTNIITPHVPWYCEIKKPVKALFIIAPNDERTVAELAQRMPLEYEVVSMACNADDKYPRKWTLEKVYNDLGGRLLHHDFDVIIVAQGETDYSFMPIINQIKTQIACGAGLVYVGNLPRDGVPISFLPLYASSSGTLAGDMTNSEHYVAIGFNAMRFDPAQAPEITDSGSIVVAKNCFLVGARDAAGAGGRTVQVAWPKSDYLLPDNDPSSSASQREQAYYALCRAIAWAAKRDQDFPALSIGVKDDRLVADGGGDAGIIDDFTGEIINSWTGRVSQLAPGDYLAFSVNGVKAGMTRIAIPESPEKIDEITMERDPVPYVKAGETMKGCVRLSDKAAQSTEKLILDIDFYDGYGRLVDRQNKEATGQEIAFEHSYGSELAAGCFMTAALRNADKIMSRKKKDYLVWLDRQWDDFEVIVLTYSVVSHPYSQVILNSLREMGATAINSSVDSMTTGAKFVSYLKAGMHVFPWDGRYTLHDQVKNTMEDVQMYDKTGDKKYLARKPVITDQVYREELKEGFQQTLKEWLPYHFWGYCLGDEQHFNKRELQYYDFCFADQTMREMREWLKKEYGSLEELNKTWGTTFALWDNVMPMTAKEVLARDGKLGYAPWADHRSYIDTLAADWYGWMRNLAHEIDPELKIGTSGTQAASAYGGLDYAKLTPNWDYLHNYWHVNQHEFIRSFVNIKTAGWSGYGAYGEGARWFTWREIINGGSGISFYHEMLCCNYDGALNPCGLDYKDHLWELRHGLGKLLMHLDKDIPPIAVHYSQASMQAAYIMKTVGPMGGNTTLPIYDNNRLGMIYALDDIGLQYKFVSYTGIEAGELESGKYKALFLPYSMAISTNEAEHIKAFVRNGGVVIADALPGLMDNHCAWQSGSLLADVFGLGTEGISKPTNFPDISMPLPPHNASTSLEGKGAKNNQLIVSRYGEGYGIYLNCVFDGYVNALETNTEMKYGKILKGILGWCGITPKHEIVFADSRAPVDGCESMWYKDAGSEYLMIIRGTPQGRVHPNQHTYVRKPEAVATPVNIKLSQGGYIYDMRAKQDIGQGDEIKANLPYNGVLMYAVHRMPSPLMSAEATVSEGMARIKVKTEGARPGLSVVNLDLVRPGEDRTREYDYYMRNVILRDGVGEVDIPLALNDPKGKWQLNGFDVGWGEFVRGHFDYYSTTPVTNTNTTVSVSTNSLTAYWRMDGLGGLSSNAVFDSAGTNTGAAYGGVSPAPTGYIAGALFFNGLTGRIHVPSAEALKYRGGNMTMSAWIKIGADETTGGYIISKPWNGMGYYNYYLVLDTNKKLKLYLGGSNAISVSSGTALTVEEWHQVGFTFGDDKTMRIYMDGVEVGSATHNIINWIPVYGDINLPLAIGSVYPYNTAWAGNSAYSFRGMIDDMRLYNRALSADEIWSIYQAIAPEITTQPADQTVTVGQTATFNVKANGTVPMSYQWRKNGVDISGATNASYTTPETITADNGAVFSVVVINAVGDDMTSGEATLTVKRSQVITFPVIPDQLRTNLVTLTATASSGLPVSFTVASGPAQITGGILSFTGFGSVRVVATQDGNANWNAARPVANTIMTIVVSVSTNSLAAHWKMDGLGGLSSNVVFDSAGTNTGAAYGGVSPASMGYIAGAMSFDGLTGRIHVPSAEALKYRGGNMTLSAWIKIGADERTGGYIISKAWNGRSQYNYYLKLETDRKLSLCLGGSNAVSVSFGTALSADEWHQVGFTFGDDKTMRIYMDGVEVGSTTHNITNWTPVGGDGNFTLVIGSVYPYGSTWAGNSTLSFRGMIDDMRLYSRALSADEMWSIYRAGAPEITTQPDDQTVTVGQTATFSVMVSGAEPMNYQWQKNGWDISGATNASYTTPETIPADNGAVFSVVVVNAAGNVTSREATLTVIKNNQVITFPAIPAQLTTNLVPLTATASSGLPVSFAVASGPAQITGGTLSFTGAGSVRVVATQAGNASWNVAAPVTNTFTVTKATARVTLNNITQTYDGTPRVVTATTVPSGLSVTLTYNGSAEAPTAIGSYAVTGVVNTVLYQGQAVGTLTVAKKTLWVKADAKTMVMGSTVPTLTYTVSGLVNGDTVATVLSGALATTATSASPAGIYPITRGTLTANANYILNYIGANLTVPEAGIVGWWNLDEINGVMAADSSGYGNNGALNNGPRWTSGQIGGALNFDGANDYVTASNVAVNTTTGGVNTVAFWMKWNGNGNQMPFAWGGTYYDLFLGNGYFGINTGNGDMLGIPFTSTNYAEEWVHVAAVFPNGTPTTNNAKLFINGVPQTLAKCTGNMPSSKTATSNVFLSGWNTNNTSTYKFGGAIDDVRVYSRELTEVEVMALASVPPALWLKLDETSGTTAVDFSGYGHNGTLWNGPVWTSGQIGGALNFDGANDYMTASNVAVNTTTGGVNTVAFWMKWNGNGNQMPFAWGGTYYDLFLGNGYFGINTGNGDMLGIPFTSTNYAEEWVHVAAVFPNGTPTTNNAKLFINGVPQTLAKCTGNMPSSKTATSNVFLSGWNTNNTSTYKFGGAIDDVRVYSRELTEVEVMALASVPPALWLKLDETSGTTAVDFSGYGHNGTLWNGPVWTSGQIGGALNFDGANDYVTASNVVVNTTTGGVNTVAFWMKWNGNGNQMPFAWGGTYYNLFLGNGYFGINTGNADMLGIPFTSANYAGEWVHVAAVFPNGMPTTNNAKLFINGVPQTLVKCTANMPLSRIATSNVFLSGWNTNNTSTYRFGGAIDDARIYNRELTVQEIADLANQSSTLAIASPTPGANFTASAAMTIHTTASADGTIDKVKSLSGACADYDGDGKADWAVYDEGAGTWRVKLSGANDSLRVTDFNGLGGPGYVSVSADYDGDGLADPAVYQELTGRWIILPSTANYSVAVTLTLGESGYSAMPADYDGDKFADPGVYQRTQGDWKVLLSSANYDSVEILGLLGGTGYRAVAADYDGDMKADPAIYEENNGVWAFRMSSANYQTIILTQSLGGTGYIPVPTDYDGDGLADPAVRSATGNEWIVMFSSGGYTPVPLTIAFE